MQPVRDQQDFLAHGVSQIFHVNVSDIQFPLTGRKENFEQIRQDEAAFFLFSAAWARYNVRSNIVGVSSVLKAWNTKHQRLITSSTSERHAGLVYQLVYRSVRWFFKLVIISLIM